MFWVFLLLFFNYSQAQSSNADLDKVKKLNKYASKYLYINLEKAEYYALKAQKIAKNRNLEKELAQSFEYLGEVAFSKNDFGTSINHYIQSIQLYKKNRKQSKVIDMYLKIAEVHIENKTFNKAEKYLKKAFTLCNNTKQNYERYKGLIYNFLGVVYHKIGNTAEAHQYFLNAITTFEKIQAKEVITSYINIAEIMEQEDKPKKAEEFLGKAFAMAQKTPHNKYLLAVYFALGKHYFRTNNYKQAEEFCYMLWGLAIILLIMKKSLIYISVCLKYMKNKAFLINL